MSQNKITSEETAAKEYKLDAEMELRFEVEGKATVLLELKGGLAEIFGTELVQNKKYTFSNGAKIAVFTWYGCTLELSGSTETVYVSNNTPMVIYNNIHGYLEQVRQKAEIEESRGPIVLICGPSSVGKSTLGRILLNYAVRSGRSPVFVDLDVGQGQISVPGTIGALLVQKTFDVEEGFLQQAPLIYHYGHKSPGNNIILHKLLISRLADSVGLRANSNRRTSVSGTFINTCGWVKGEGYQSIMHAVSAFKVDIVLVIDHERLYHELVRDIPDFVNVILIPKSEGVVDQSQKSLAEAQDSKVREYFYGLKTPLYPHSFNVKFTDIKVYKIGVSSLPDSCMPFGMRADDFRTKLVPIKIGLNLLHRVLSLSFVTSVKEDIINTNVAGFICVTDVDMDRQVLTVLSPQPRPLPKAILLMGEVQFMDAH